MSGLLYKVFIYVLGGVCALAMLFCALFLKRYSSAITTGTVGATLHIITQIWVIDHLYIRGIFSASIAGWFIMAALCTGILTGITATVMINRLAPVLPGLRIYN